MIALPVCDLDPAVYSFGDPNLDWDDALIAALTTLGVEQFLYQGLVPSPGVTDYGLLKWRPAALTLQR
jgi:hypothetical protein